MADAIARQAQDGSEDAALATSPRAERRAVPWARARMWGWLALCALFAAFLLLGSVTVGAGNWNGWHMRIVRIWQRFTEYLVGEGASWGIVLAVSGTALVAIAGGALLVLLAVGLRNSSDEPTDTQRDAH